MDEKIDVLVPVYNGARYVKKCILSLMNQTYKNINIIILDDGSIDDSFKIVNELAKEDARIKIYSKANEKNISLTRNYLLDKITSPYFIFVDSDDYVSKYFIEHLYKALISTSSSMACCEYTVFKSFLSHNKKLKNICLYESRKAIPNFVLGRRGHYMLWNKLIKSSLIRDIKFNNDINYGEDMFFVLDVMQRNNYQIVSISNKLYFYKFFNFKSISKGGLNDNKKIFLETLIKYEKERKYEENTNVITIWIFLTASYYLFLIKHNKNTLEYRKYLMSLMKERLDTFNKEGKNYLLKRR